MEASHEEEGRGQKDWGAWSKEEGLHVGVGALGRHGDYKSRDRAGGGVTNAVDSSERGEPLAT